MPRDGTFMLEMAPWYEKLQSDYICDGPFRYDALTGVVACPGIYLPAINESCYVSRKDVFGSLDAEE